MDYLHEETRALLQGGTVTRYHLGCGTNFLKGWLNINYWEHLEQGRLFANANWGEGALLLNHDLRLGIPAEPNSLDAVYHCHMLEHIKYAEGMAFLEKIFQVLKPGAIHRIVVPDLEAFARAYLSTESFLLDKYREYALRGRDDVYYTKASIFMGMVHNHGHQCMYDWETLRWCLEKAGFRNITRKMYQESDLQDIQDIEKYSPLRAAESLCVECCK